MFKNSNTRHILLHITGDLEPDSKSNTSPANPENNNKIRSIKLII